MLSLTERAVQFARKCPRHKGSKTPADVESAYSDVTSLQLHTRQAPEVLGTLGVDLRRGLNQAEAEQRKTLGSNALPQLWPIDFVDGKKKGEPSPPWVQHVDCPSGFACLREGKFHVLEYTELVVGDLV